MADKSEDKDSRDQGHQSLYIGIFFVMGFIQGIIQILATFDWIDSTVLAWIVSFFLGGFVLIPIPWFAILHWYVEGTLPWGHTAAWVIGWGSAFLGIIYKRQT